VIAAAIEALRDDLATGEMQAEEVEHRLTLIADQARAAERTDPSVALAKACYRIFVELPGVDQSILAPLGSWRDTLDDQEVIEALEDVADRLRRELAEADHG